jgi:hypothetical protein
MTSGSMAPAARMAVAMLAPPRSASSMLAGRVGRGGVRRQDAVREGLHGRAGRDVVRADAGALDVPGNQLVQRGMRLRGDLPGLRQVRGVAVRQHVLVEASVAEHPHVREGRERQERAERVARLGAHIRVVRHAEGLAVVLVHEVGVAPLHLLVLDVVLGDVDGLQARVVRFHRFDEAAVRIEDEVHRLHVRRLKRRAACLAGRQADRVRHEVPVAAVGHAHVVEDVARGLLDVRGETAVLDVLAREHRDVLERDVHALELRDGVVAERDEDALEELVRVDRVDGAVRGEKLLEERLAETALRAAVPCETRAHDAGKARDRVDVLLRAGHVFRELRFLRGGEVFHSVPRSVTGARAP